MLPLVGVALLAAPDASPSAWAERVENDVIRYTVKLPEPQTQTAEIVMEVPGVAAGAFDVAIPVWRPGRYALIDPATTISHVRAEDASQRALPIEKIDKSTWRITTPAPTTVRVTYRVYANSLNDRTRHIDETHAFLSPASVFMYPPTMRTEPLTVRVEAPDGWRTSTGLARTADGLYQAPDYDVLVDSPLEIGRHDLHTFEVGGVPHEIVIWHAGTASTRAPSYDAERMKKDFAAIVEAQVAIFGDMPYERYVFQVHSGPGLSGGTEHLNSTIMQTSRTTMTDSLDGNGRGGAYDRFLGLVSHEMFHTWNVKQLRPADLKPYEYAHEDYTRLLWVAEGVTSYYDDLVLVRAGLMDADEYISMIEGLIQGQTNLSGWNVQSLEDSSFDAWVKFNKSWADSINTTVSFYSKGALISLVLDLELRTRTENRVSLDAVMRRMYKDFPLKGPGFTTADMLRVVNEMSGSDFAPFFRDYIAGTERPDFNRVFAVVGLTCSSEPMTKDAYLGLNVTEKDGRAVVTSANTDGPAYLAGLIADDELVAVDRRRFRVSELQDRVEAKSPGERMVFTVLRRDELRTVEVTLAENPHRKWTVEAVDEPSNAQKEAFESWLGVEWPD